LKELMAGNLPVSGGVGKPLGSIFLVKSALGGYRDFGGVIGIKGMSEFVMHGRGVGLDGGGVERRGECTGTGTKT
jgi:hypothetical protein